MLTALLMSGMLAAAEGLPLEVSVSPPSGPARAGEAVQVAFDIVIQPGFHIYAPDSKGGLPFTATPAKDNPFPAEGRLEGPPPQRHFDEVFGAEVATYENVASLTLSFRIPPGTAPGTYTLKGSYAGQVCDETMCLSVDETPWEAVVTVEAGEARTGAAAPPPDEVETALAGGALRFFWVALGWGFATLLTPCVYPMVPVTLAYFSKQGATGRSALVLAGVYAFGIVSLFTLVGILASLAVKGGVVAFGNDPWVNLFIGAIFTVFALSLFGAFDLTLPSSLVGSVTGGRKEGVLGALFLGFVFAVTSFACTAPFAGSVLALGLGGGGWLMPVVGMIGFSTALALPFFLLGAFPGMLKTLPRSGSWMQVVKHVCAFVELGAALKFLGAADVNLWEFDLFTRPVVLALWAALSLACGLYLLGCWTFHAETNEGSGTVRILFGTGFLALGLFFGAGLASGANLGPWEAFLTVPEGDAPRTAPGHAREEGLPWIQGDFPRAQAEAAASGRRIFIDFGAPT